MFNILKLKNENVAKDSCRWGISYFFSDVAVFIYVVQIERPVEFFLYCPPEQDGKTLDEILKRNKKYNLIW